MTVAEDRLAHLISDLNLLLERRRVLTVVMLTTTKEREAAAIAERAYFEEERERFVRALTAVVTPRRRPLRKVG